MRAVFEGKEVEDNYCAWRCSLENGDHQDSFGGPYPSSDWAAADARHTPKPQKPYSYFCGTAGLAAAAGTRGREWPLEQCCV